MMEKWFRLHFEPLLSIAREKGVAGVAQLVKTNNVNDALPGFFQGVLAMIDREGEHVTYRVIDKPNAPGYVDTHENGMIGYWWFTDVSPEEIEQYVL
jgi:hypothetical protein